MYRFMELQGNHADLYVILYIRLKHFAAVTRTAFTRTDTRTEVCTTLVVTGISYIEQILQKKSLINLCTFI